MAVTICHALEISYACSVYVNNLVVNTLVDKFPMKQILEKSTLRYVTDGVLTLYANAM